MKIDIVTCDDIKIYYTGNFQDFTARYIIKICLKLKHGVTLRQIKFIGINQCHGVLISSH